jgi:Fe-S cluster assembly protein SufD
MAGLQTKGKAQHQSLFALKEKSAEGGFSALSREAFARFESMGFPSAQHEDWKYTQLQGFLEQEWRLGGHDVAQSDFQSALSLEGIQLVVIDGQFRADLSDAMPAGVTMRALSEVLLAGDAQVQTLMSLADAGTQGQAFCDLNTAFMQHGFVLEVAKNVHIEAPIIVRYQFSQAAHRHQFFWRNVIRVAQSSQLRLLEVFESHLDEVYAVNTFNLIEVADNAQLDHVKLAVENQHVWHFGYQLATVARDARVNSTSVLLGSHTTRQETQTLLQGDNGQAHVNSLYFAQDQQTLDTRSVTKHLAVNCFSHQLHRGVVMDQAQGVFSGLIYVDPVAQKTDGQMDNNVLLLSPHAKNDSKPQLEIYADDVKCSHGFTCGQLDEKQIFYMRARGIPEEQARQLITYAFAAGVIESIEHPALVAWVDDQIMARLKKVF